MSCWESGHACGAASPALPALPIIFFSSTSFALVASLLTPRPPPPTGVHYPLPAGYRAYLLPPPATDDAGLAVDAPDPTSSTCRAFPAAASWPALVSWALDAVPTAGDPARRALDWVGVAEACAGHVGAAAVTAAMEGGGGGGGGGGVAV